MSEIKNALLLVGSPKGSQSTSDSLGGYLLKKLEEHGMITNKAYIHTSIKTDRDRTKFLKAVEDSDLLILSFPLYVDNLPSPVIASLEMIAEHRLTLKEARGQKLIAISNNGFPEARQNDTAIEICRRFALEIGIEWVGGLALGGGGTIAGRSLEAAGGMARNIMNALDLSAIALVEGKSIPAEAFNLFAKPLVPSWMFVWFGGQAWKRVAKQNGVQNRLYDRPYEK